MSDQPSAPGTDPTVPTTEPKPSFENDPAYKAMQAELAQFKQADIDRAKAADDAAKAAKITEAESAKDYEAVKKLHADEVEAMKNQHKEELKKRDLSNELLKNNAIDPFFTRVAVMDYDGKTDISTYVAELKNTNPQYFEKPGRTPQDPPATGPVSLSTTKPTLAKLDHIVKTGTPEQVSEARDYMGQYFDTHGKFPD